MESKSSPFHVDRIDAQIPVGVVIALLTGLEAGRRAMARADVERLISRLADAVRVELFGPVTLPSPTDLALLLGVTVLRVGELPAASKLMPRRWTSIVRGSPVAVVSGADAPAWLVSDGILEACGVAVLSFAGIPAERCIEPDLLDVAARIAGAIIVPDAVISDIAGEPTPYREGNLEDEARFESNVQRIIARTHAHEDLANDRINAWLFGHLGEGAIVLAPGERLQPREVDAESAEIMRGLVEDRKAALVAAAIGGAA